MKATTGFVAKRLSYGAAAMALVLGVVSAVLAGGATSAYASTYQPVSAAVPVHVAVEGDDAPEQEFTFAIEPESADSAAPEESNLSITGAGDGAFALSFNQVGEHHYKVTQVPGNAENWTYDAQVYEVTVFCMWNEKDDSLYTQVVVEDEQGFKAEGCNFQNTYAAPSAPSEDDQAATSGVKTGDVLGVFGAVAAVLAVVALGVGFVASRRRRNS